MHIDDSQVAWRDADQLLSTDGINAVGHDILFPDRMTLLREASFDDADIRADPTPVTETLHDTQ